MRLVPLLSRSLFVAGLAVFSATVFAPVGAQVDNTPVEGPKCNGASDDPCKDVTTVECADNRCVIVTHHYFYP